MAELNITPHVNDSQNISNSQMLGVDYTNIQDYKGQIDLKQDMSSLEQSGLEKNKNMYEYEGEDDEEEYYEDGEDHEEYGEGDEGNSEEGYQKKHYQDISDLRNMEDV